MYIEQENKQLEDKTMLKTYLIIKTTMPGDYDSTSYTIGAYQCGQKAKRIAEQLTKIWHGKAIEGPMSNLLESKREEIRELLEGVGQSEEVIKAACDKVQLTKEEIAAIEIPTWDHKVASVREVDSEPMLDGLI